MLPIVIAVNGLSQQRDFAGALIHQLGDLPENIRQPTAALRTPRVGHNAEGAAIVTASLYRHEGSRTLIPHCGHIFIVFPGAKLGVSRTLATLSVAQKLGQVPIRIGTSHEVDTRNLREECGTESLGHTPHYPQNISCTFMTLELSHSTDYPLLSVITHGAGVHQHHIGVGRILSRLIPHAAEHSKHQLGVRHVHLTAIGLDIDAFHEGQI
jgi:hypothetical protein